jgi:hypothetical protein
MTTKINSIKCKPTLKIYRTDGAQTGWEKRLDAKVQSYPAVGEDCDWDEIILCYCQFEPIESKWERVATLEEIVAEQVAKDTGLEVAKS